jgi:hypothetical protein
MLNHYGCGKNWKKQDTERLFRMLIIKQILFERCELNGMGFPMSYLQLGSQHNLPNTQRIFLTLTTEDNTKSSSSSTASSSTSRLSSSDMQITCYRALVELRNDVNLFAYSRYLKTIRSPLAQSSKTVYYWNYPKHYQRLKTIF